MQILVAKRDKRARDRGVETGFLIRGAKLDEDRIRRFSQRQKVSDAVSPSAGA